MMIVKPVQLNGKVVRLEPLQMKHAAALFEISQYPDIWRYMPYDPSASIDAMEQWITTALAAQDAGREVPFATIELETGRVVGSTRYLNIVPQDRGLEIGSTWITPALQRTAVNTECKYLLLKHAFESLGAIRVQLKTDSRNLRSQRAIERLGAVREGVLRNHMIMPDNYYRHSVYYSVIEDEWPVVKAGLETKMNPTTNNG